VLPQGSRAAGGGAGWGSLWMAGGEEEQPRGVAPWERDSRPRCSGAVHGKGLVPWLLVGVQPDGYCAPPEAEEGGRSTGACMRHHG